MTLRQELAQLLRQARVSIDDEFGKPISRRGLARREQLSQTTLSDLEDGQSNCTLDRLERIAEVYGVEIHLTARPAKRRK